MAWDLLIGSDFGILSLVTIGFVIVMAIGFSCFFRRKINQAVALKKKQAD